MSVDPLVQDSKIRPDGYEPPTSAEELLERYAAGERYFVGAKLEDVRLIGQCFVACNFMKSEWQRVNLASGLLVDCDFSEARWIAVRLGRARLLRCCLRAASLTGVDLREAKLVGVDASAKAQPPGPPFESSISHMGDGLMVNTTGRTDLYSCQLSDADLSGADFTHSVLVQCDLTGAALKDCRLGDAQVGRLRLGGVNLAEADLGDGVHHLAPSHVATSTLDATEVGLRYRPEAIKHVEEFLEGCGVARLNLPWLRDHRDGLTLYFSTKLTPEARFLLDGVIYGTVGFDRCEVVQFEQREDSAVVRLQATDPADLLTVADALYERVWEMQDQAQTVALQRLDKVFQLNVMGAVIGTMADKIERMELRLASETAQRLGDLLGPDAIEMLRDQGAKHIQGKDSKLVMTWSQKGGRALGKSLVKKITGGVSKEIEGEVKSSVKGLLEDE